jgi:UDP-N-acetylglucosamine transferase subunit ALG13
VKKRLNILISPLEWGLGHATRMIPLAKKLTEMNNNIFIASGDEHLMLLQNELPGLSFIRFPGFKPGYSRFLPQYLALLLKIPELLYHITREHFALKRIICDHSIDIVISDNRFGLWNRNITTVYVTHMPLIPFPKSVRFLEFLGIAIHKMVIKKYSLCFIPDLPGGFNLSGRLSHGIKLTENSRFIGILSRFTSSDASPEENSIKFQHNTVILSGPEPQREILKEKLIGILKNSETRTIMLGGNPVRTGEMATIGNITLYEHLPSSGLKEIIKGSKNIISRSGYTTIMDLICLNCSALLIPTPGQTEQEYLAEYLSEKGWFSSITQQKLNVSISFNPVKTVSYSEILSQSENLLTKALQDLMEKHQKKSRQEIR